MISNDDRGRGPPIGVITPLDSDNNDNNDPTQAILSVYKSFKDFSTAARRPSTTTTSTKAPPIDGFNPNTTLCTYAIPSYMSVPDFLNFVAPVDSFVSHYRVLCDDTPHSYLVLMTFRDEKVKHDYYKQYNNRKFSSMEDQVCQIVFLQSIMLMTTCGQDNGTTGDLASPFFSLDDGCSGGVQNNCPVCLDPMDDSVTGLLTTSCQHTFHVHCLSQWGDGSCPVCRYSQKPRPPIDIVPPSLQPTLQQQQQHQKQHFFLEMDGATTGTNNTAAAMTTGSRFSQQDDFTNACQECGWTENLWICLVCGQIGCGQEHEAHALIHYTATHHIYALDIDSQRVWDYAGDNYVHRLIQNVVDGKLVELPHPMQQQDDDAALSEIAQGKLNAMALEYSYLLTSQLDSQRMYYEDRINTTLDTLTQMSDGCKQTTRALDLIQSENDEVACLEQQVEEARKQNAKLIHKLALWKDKTKTMERNYLEEKELTSSISQNNALVKADIDKIQQRLDIMAAKSAEWMACLESSDDGPSGS